MIKNIFRSVASRLLPDVSKRSSSISPDIMRDDRFREIFMLCQPNTMTSIERMYALYQAVRYVKDSGVVGDMVECGVWKGGSAMLVAETLKRMGDTGRNLYLYDTYSGMSEPTEKDKSFKGASAQDMLAISSKDDQSSVWCYSSLDEVKDNMKKTGYPPEKMVFVEGKVEETLPVTKPEKISLLRLDTDWYESTKAELEHLYPLLSPGGVLIIDDYGHWQGARQAVDEYLAEHKANILLNRIDYTGRIGIKSF